MFSIDTDVIRKQSLELGEISDELARISNSIDNIGARMKMDYKYYTSISNVKNSINVISKSVKNRSKKVAALGSGLSSCVSEYIKAENDICQGRVSAPQTGGGSGGGGGSSWGGSPESSGGEQTGGGSWKTTDDTGFHSDYGDDKNIKDKARNKNPDNDIKRRRTVDGEEVDKDEYDNVKGAEKKGAIAEYEVGVEYDNGKENPDIGTYKTDGSPYAGAAYNFGRARADATFKTGIYQYDKNGNKIIAPSVNAKCGASYSLINFEGKAGAGDENLGIEAQGEINVGKVSAEVESNIDFISNDGKLDPQVNISANAEAIAVEAEGEVDIKILGTESKLSAGVNVGVGAHLDVGIEDGKIKCDLGASLGVGFNVGFELDVGGMVNNGVKAVKSGAKSAWKKFKSWF